MKLQTDNSRQVVDRFLEKLGEPLPGEQVERGTGRVLARLLLPDSLQNRYPVRRVVPDSAGVVPDSVEVSRSEACSSSAVWSSPLRARRK